MGFGQAEGVVGPALLGEGVVDPATFLKVVGGQQAAQAVVAVGFQGGALDAGAACDVAVRYQVAVVEGVHDGGAERVGPAGAVGVGVVGVRPEVAVRAREARHAVAGVIQVAGGLAGGVGSGVVPDGLAEGARVVVVGVGQLDPVALAAGGAADAV